MKYDVIIVGAGPAGIYSAYELAIKSPEKKILLLDKGRDIYKRNCPILDGKIQHCPDGGCKPACSITAGFGGAGAYSDGKFNITTEFGGWLSDYIDQSDLLELIKYVDAINLKHGATTTLTDPLTEDVRLIEQQAYGAGLKLLRSHVRHLGTEQNLMILKDIYKFLATKIDVSFGTEVKDILTKEENGKVVAYGVETYDGKYESDYVVVVPGRDGAKWLTSILSKRNILLYNNQVDIGVRLETSDIIMQDINKHLYEGKFIFNTSVGTKVRTFCSNPSGHVVVENHSGVIAANGHAFKDPKLGSNNTNFALLVSHTFSEPFSDPNGYAREICKLANDLSDGSVIVQSYGDILRGRRSTRNRINEGFLEPTLKEAVPGDLGLVLPYNTMKSLIEMMDALNIVTPGIALEHTLFYGVEAKFYSARPQLNKSLESEIVNLYCGGDGAGVTRGLAQAGAAGVLIARNILSKN
ncbi:MAG: NAD(P)/FAD-dependent oxidoreductase [Lachnospirales bacterium]